MSHDPESPRGHSGANPSSPVESKAAEEFPEDCAETYSLVRRVGAGGFATVYEGLHRRLGSSAAIKILHACVLDDADQVRRFSTEAKVTAQLSHPNIIQVLDFGSRSGIPWIAYEFVPGPSLRQLLEKSPGGMPVEDALRAIVQIAAALSAAHDAGGLHRDIKPDNVLLKGSHPEWTCKVADFGIAKWSGAGAVQTQAGLILGTPAYLSPELVRGDPPSPASDVYALGVTLFELLTGSLPYFAENPMVLLQYHVQAEIPRLSARRPDLPRALDAVITRALAKETRDRHPSAAELARDLAGLAPGPARAPTTSGGTALTPAVPRSVTSRSLSTTGLREPRTSQRTAVQSRPDRSVGPIPATSSRWRTGLLAAALLIFAAAAPMVYRLQRPAPPPSPSPASPSPSAEPAQSADFLKRADAYQRQHFECCNTFRYLKVSFENSVESTDVQRAARRVEPRMLSLNHAGQSLLEELEDHIARCHGQHTLAPEVEALALARVTAFLFAGCAREFQRRLLGERPSARDADDAAAAARYAQAATRALLEFLVRCKDRPLDSQVINLLWDYLEVGGAVRDGSSGVPIRYRKQLKEGLVGLPRLIRELGGDGARQIGDLMEGLLHDVPHASPSERIDALDRAVRALSALAAPDEAAQSSARSLADELKKVANDLRSQQRKE